MAAVRALSFLEVVLLISRELVSSPVHRPPNSFLLTYYRINIVNTILKIILLSYNILDEVIYYGFNV